MLVSSLCPRSGIFVLALFVILAFSTTAFALDNPVFVTKGMVNLPIYGKKQIVRTSSGRIYYLNGDAGHNYMWDGWVEVHTSMDGQNWTQVASHDQWYWTSSINVAIDSHDVIHVITYDWNQQPYYEKFNTSDSPKGDHSWEGYELLGTGSTALAIDSADIPHIVLNGVETYKGKQYFTLYYLNKVGGSWNKVSIIPKEYRITSSGQIGIAIGPDNRPYILMGSKVFRGNANNATAFEQVDLGFEGRSFVIHANGDLRVALSYNGNYAHYVHDHAQPWNSGWTLHDSGTPDSQGILILVHDIPYTVLELSGRLYIQREFESPIFVASVPPEYSGSAYNYGLTPTSRWSFFNNHSEGVIDMGIRSWRSSTDDPYNAGNYFWYAQYRAVTDASFSATPRSGFSP